MKLRRSTEVAAHQIFDMSDSVNPLLAALSDDLIDLSCGDADSVRFRIALGEGTFDSHATFRARPGEGEPVW